MLIPGAVEDYDELFPLYAQALTDAWAFKDEKEKQEVKGLADGLTSPATRYRRRFSALFAENVFVPVEIPSEETGELETFHAKLLSANEIKQVGLSLARIGVSLSDTDETLYHEALYSAILFHGVWNLDEGPRHFFADEVEACDWWNTPGQTAINMMYLAQTIVDINPFDSATKKAMGRPETASLDVLRRLQRIIQMRGE